MSTIVPYIANAAGKLSNFTELINSTFNEARLIAEKELKADKIDAIFLDAPSQVIPEYGVGGYSLSGNIVYISIDPDSDKITKQELLLTILHEVHHCMRYRGPGYGETLGEAMISEGMASLYETEHSSKPPIYVTVNITEEEVARAKSLLNDKTYDHSEWFFGTKSVSRWFGYTYGYRLCKGYAERHHTNAREMVSSPAKLILNDKYTNLLGKK